MLPDVAVWVVLLGKTLGSGPPLIMMPVLLITPDAGAGELTVALKVSTGLTSTLLEVALGKETGPSPVAEALKRRLPGLAPAVTVHVQVNSTELLAATFWLAGVGLPQTAEAPPVAAGVSALGVTLLTAALEVKRNLTSTVLPVETRLG